MSGTTGPNEKLRYERLKRGWSQEKLADVVGTSKGMVSRWECGVRVPNMYHQSKLCELFGKTTDELGLLSSLPQEEHSVRRESFSQGILDAWYTRASQLTDSLAPALESDDEAMKRREASKAIASFGLQLLGFPVWEDFSQALVSSSSFKDKETLAHIEQLGDVCWRLANNNQGTMVTQILPTFLPQLTLASAQPSPYQKHIASLAARSYILAAEVEKKNIVAMQSYCESAVVYSQMTDDFSIQADALRQKATIALIAKELSQAVSTYQQALVLAQKVSPLLRSRIYLGAGSAYARNGQKQEALRYMSLARESYPAQPETDPEFLYLATSSDRAALHLYEALIYSDLQQPKEAWDALMHVDRMQPKLPLVESTRIEFLNLQAKTAAVSSNLEQSSAYLTESVKAGKKSGHTIWMQEAYDVYLTLEQLWPQEKRVKSLAILFQ